MFSILHKYGTSTRRNSWRYEIHIYYKRISETRTTRRKEEMYERAEWTVLWQYHDYLEDILNHKVNISCHTNNHHYFHNSLNLPLQLDNHYPLLHRLFVVYTSYFSLLITKEKLVEYLDYHIDWYNSCASRFGLISFDRGNPIVGMDLYSPTNSNPSSMLF